MRKKVIFFIAILLLCLAGWGFYLYNKPRNGVSSLQPDVTITAEDLYRQYAADEQQADKKFLNKVILVTGVITEVAKTDSTCLVQLQGDSISGVSCNFFTSDRKVNIKKGETLSTKGRCTGFLMDVALTDCIIQTKQ